MAARKKTAATRKGKATAARHRAIQKQADALDKKKARAKKSDKPKPVQAGTRKQPQTPLPKQHLAKPGNEHALDPEPRFLAPDYAGSGKQIGRAHV